MGPFSNSYAFQNPLRSRNHNFVFKRQKSMMSYQIMPIIILFVLVSNAIHVSLLRTFWENKNVDHCTRHNENDKNELFCHTEGHDTMHKNHEFNNLPYADGLVPTGSISVSAQERWRYSLTEQLKQQANAKGFVLLTAANYAYQEHLMNFVCSLERLGMDTHLVIAALDEKIYKWGLLKGLPIFLVGEGQSKSSNSEEIEVGGKFGTKSYNAVCKRKIAATQEVLDIGYSVVFSDVDITWFAHPFDALADYMHSSNGITIQSDTPYLENQRNISVIHNKTLLPYINVRLINSGLYVAPNTPLVRQAFADIAEHAAKNMHINDQDSFLEILCTRTPSKQGSSNCRYQPSFMHRPLENFLKKIPFIEGVIQLNKNHDLHVEVLDQFRFPNGAVMVSKDNKNVYDLGKEQFSNISGDTLYAVHNNWIVGENEKKQRQKEAGFWFIDSSTCQYHGT